MARADQRRIEKDLNVLATFNSTPGQGLTRLSYTKEYRDAQAYLRTEMEKLGMSVRLDAIGNLIGRLAAGFPEEGQPGCEKNLNEQKEKPQETSMQPALAVGSHLDSVRGGGIFDGNMGIVCGLEVARMLQENNVRLRHPFEVIAIVEEEGNTFGSGIMGGKAIAGTLDESLLDALTDERGHTVRQVMQDFELNPASIVTVKRSSGNLAAFIEPHIEQGPVLESENLSVGVVDTIVGIRTREIEIVGRPDHGGTTPMHLRKDAVTAMTEVICRPRQTVEGLDDGTVLTCGSIRVEPGTVNVVPGKAVFSVECRSRNQESLNIVFEQVGIVLDKLREQGFVVLEKPLMELAPTHLSDRVTAALRRGLSTCGFTEKVLPSGAGHDSMCIAGITDVGMVFVASRDGRSHCPEEYSDPKDIADACNVVFEALMELDQIFN